MLLDHQQLLVSASAAVASAPTVVDACRAAVTTLSQPSVTAWPPHLPERVSVLLWAHDRLRTVAATGSWQTFATVPPGSGVTSRVWESGKPAVVPVVTEDPDYVPLRSDVRSEMCVPIRDPAGRRLGVLDLEWTEPVDLEPWCQAAWTVGELLGRRIAELGGPPAETCAEKLLRHVAAMTSATTEWELRIAAMTAARDISELRAAVLVLPGPDGTHPIPLSSSAAEPTAETATPPPTAEPSPAASAVPRPRMADSDGAGANPSGGDGADADLAERMVRALAAADPAAVDHLVERTHRFGAAYTLGEPDRPTTSDAEPLSTVGIGTLIAVPVGRPEIGGMLLVADERVARPDPSTVNLMELLAAQVWACLERLRGLARLRERASSDPLTGLRHHGPFGERMATATPGRTALLAIDVDGFKNVNDTYGHQAGDQVLIELARALEGALRQGDELYRIGGDEFVAVVEVGRPEEAVGIAERLAGAARQLRRTISVGVAVQRHRELPEHTMRRADTALYEVKRRGRDGVRLAP